MRDPLRVGIIGMGMYANSEHIPALRSSGRAVVAAICRRNPEALALFAERLEISETYTDWREMIARANLDAVVVSTPNNAHTEPVLGALEHGLHVLVDKPMALSSQEARTMVAAAERAGRVLMVGYAARAMAPLRSMRQQIRDGAIGRVRQISCAVTVSRRWLWQPGVLAADFGQTLDAQGFPRELYAGWQAWHADPSQMGGGAFADIGPHFIDLLLWMADAPPAAVAAFTEHDGLPAEALISLQARLEGGTHISLSFGDIAQSGSDEHRSLLVIGDQGRMGLDTDWSTWVIRGGERRPLEMTVPGTTMGAAFVATILDGAENISPGHEGVWAVDLIEGAYRSAREGQIVRLGQ